MTLFNQLNNKRFFLFTALFCTLWAASSLINTARAQMQDNEVVDQVVAIVNDHIVLKSDVDQRVADYMRNAQQQGNSNMQFDKDLWYSALQAVVDEFVLLEKAKVDSITVSDDQVNQAMDRRIQQLIQQAGSEEQLEQAFGKSLVQIRADFRERFREDMIVQQVRQQKMQEITITRPEVREYYEEIPRDSIPMVPERVALSQIVAVPQPKANAEENARKLAETLRDSVINHGKDIEDLARKYSDGPSASNGGLLPMMPVKDLVPEYSAAASALQPGEISEVVKTTYGYHVIRLNKRTGDQISTNHILIQVDKSQLDEEGAKERLMALRDSVLNHNKDFAEMARKYSDDDATSTMGGKIRNPQNGERLIPITQLDPSLYRIALLLEEEGQISEPKSFTPDQRSGNKAYRIVRLDQRIPEHKANLEQDYEMIKRFATQRKQMKLMDEWLNKLRDQVYIEFKVPVPFEYGKQS